MKYLQTEYLLEIYIIIIFSLSIDKLIGEPNNKIHPVVWIGKTIEFFTKKIKQNSNKDNKNNEKIFGISLAIILSSCIGLICYIITIQISNFFGIIGIVLFSSISLKTTYSIKAMDKHIKEILNWIEKNDIQNARKSLSKIVSRNTNSLNRQNILSACIECIAESYIDGVTSPLFFYGLLNLPGAFIYRTVNTLDSMIGYKDKYYRDIGWMSAKLDTILNAIPSRISIIFLILSFIICKQNWKNSIKIYKRDSKKTESFNAGIPMSLFAGALAIQLEKIDHYKIGDSNREIDIDKCKIALRIFTIASGLFIICFLFPIIWILNYINWWNIFFDH